ncbi:MAG: hypothetical protein J6A21_07815 [Lentisphaeria bacterium]|nr:hypothetical protein [Lentisphaeria bacterium]
MFRDDEPPVSLFSFQDIITSLTGIMIFFLLLLSLKILEITKNHQENSPVHSELSQVQSKNALLKKQIAEMEKDIGLYRERMKNARQMDESSLILEKYRLEKKIGVLKAQKEELLRKMADGKVRQSEREQRKRKLEEKKKELELAEAQREDLAKKIREKRRQNEAARRELERRKKDIQVTVDSSIDKIPVLLVCSANTIGIVDTKERKTVVIRRRTPIIPEMVKEALSRLKSFPVSQYYFVFMIKPSAVSYSYFLLEQFALSMGKADYGFEPIRESEMILHE